MKALFALRPATAWAARLTLTSIAAMACGHTHAADYYFRSTACSDTNSGLTSTAPWCTLSKASALQLNPGDTIHLANGSTWVDQFMVFSERNVGAPGWSNKLTITSYQPPDTTTSLPRPHITSSKTLPSDQATLRGITIENGSYWLVENLEISHMGVGLLFNYKKKADGTYPYNSQSIRVNNLYVHHNYGVVGGSYVAQSGQKTASADGILNSSGVLVTGSDIQGLNSVNRSVVKNVIIENVEGAHNLDSVGVDFNALLATDGTHPKEAASNVWLNRLYLHDDDQDVANNKTVTGCADGLRLTNVSNFTLMNSRLDHEASCFAPKGTAAFFAGYTGAISLLNNIISNTPATSDPANPDSASPDQGGFNMEVDNFDVGIYGNVISGNLRGIECMTFYGPYSPCYFNADNNGIISSRESALFIAGKDTYAGWGGPFHQDLSSNFKDNLISLKSTAVAMATCDGWPQTPGLVVCSSSSQTYQWLKYINTSDSNSGVQTNWLLPTPGSAQDINTFSSSAVDYAAPWKWRPWYQAADGTWTQFQNYDPSLDRWVTSAGTPSPFAASRFGLHPAVGSNVALTWQAPRDGIIAIRGRAAMAEIAAPANDWPQVNGSNAQGDGVDVRISKSSMGAGASPSYLWPNTTGGFQTISAGNLKGVSTAVTSIQVKKSDYIVFEVSARGSDTGDTLTWAPMVAYIDYAQRAAP